MNDENLLMVLEIKDDHIIGIKVNEKDKIKIKASKEFIDELKSSFNENETYLIPFDEGTMTVI
ncbi:hypothetical protein [Clostridium paraputrificum]|nr:hypothetical protein [Clostridium paraputrificum]MDB2085241.1 hypothetical protein [Clostridium paraputrificum]MDB2098821.1 hypothetical protein [Clostridium paraputrificum]